MYVIYKENKLPGVGGIHPQGIKTGIAYYQGWNLAECPEEKIHYYKEFDFVTVSLNIVNGLQILDSLIIEDAEIEAGIVGNMGAPIATAIETNLTDIDKENMEEAKKFINNLEAKLLTRSKVRELKDVEDDLVDLKRVIQSLVTFAVDDWKVKTDEEKSKSRFATIMDSLTETVATNTSSLTSIENDLKKIEEIVDMEVEIAKVVDAYYLTKKL
mgnify:CR=1 FL=1